MLIDVEIEKKYWREASNTANYLQNLLPTKCRAKTAYELWHSVKPNVVNLHVFGCRALVHIPKEQRGKLHNKSKELSEQAEKHPQTQTRNSTRSNLEVPPARFIGGMATEINGDQQRKWRWSH